MNITQKIVTMSDEQFERWIKRNGYVGLAACRLAQKRRDALQGAFNYNAPYNPEFLGAQPARAGEDY
jgi:hypothetical protein